MRGRQGERVRGRGESEVLIRFPTFGSSVTSVLVERTAWVAEGERGGIKE